MVRQSVPCPRTSRRSGTTPKSPAQPGVGAEVGAWNAADASLKSYAHMAVAAQVGCSWCLDVGYFQARNQKLDLAKASQVPVWRESDVFTPLERDVMAYAEAMTNTPPTVTDASTRASWTGSARPPWSNSPRSSPSSTSPPGPTWPAASPRRLLRRLRDPARHPARRAPRDVRRMTEDPFVAIAGCCSPSPTRCSARPPTRRRPPGVLAALGRHRPRAVRDRGRTSCAPSPGRPSTGCGRCRAAGRSTSASGSPSPC